VSSNPQPAALSPTSIGWSLILLTSLLGAALVLTTGFSLAAAREASDSLIRSEGYSRLRNLTSEARQEPERPLPPALLARHLGDGSGDDAEVFYVATYDPHTDRVSEAGASHLGRERVLATLRSRPKNPLTIVEGDLAVLVRRLPPSRAQRERHPGGSLPRSEQTYLAVEFTPDAAHRLERAASLTLGAGGVAALLLIAAAWGMARLLEKRAALERHLAEERNLAALGEMSAVLAHEIRNPLASLKGHAQLLLESLDEAGEDHGQAERVVSEALRLERLTGELLEFVRTGQVNPSETSLESFLTQCAAAAPECQVEIDLEAAPETGVFDSGRIQQALANLLHNAGQAAPTAPVVLSARREGQELVFRVRDHGPGVPSGQEEQVFQAFFTTRTRGTGLGLAVARRVAKLHGGTLRVENHPEGGAVFSLRIPSPVEGVG
jgi:two-component system, NtrC family, sensor histidine kinase HydH